MFKGKCIGKIIYTNTRTHARATYTYTFVNSAVITNSSSITTILFIIRRRCLILLVRLNEYLIGSEVGNALPATHCQIVICSLVMRVSVFAFLLVDDGFLFIDMDYIPPCNVSASLSFSFDKPSPYRSLVLSLLLLLFLF